jgi:hypothetical protein
MADTLGYSQMGTLHRDKLSPDSNGHSQVKNTKNARLRHGTPPAAFILGPAGGFATLPERVMTRRGYRYAIALRQSFAYRPDSPHQAVSLAICAKLIYERRYLFGGRSSSAAKKTEAALSIALARLSSAFSRRRRLSSSVDSVVIPALPPLSISAWRTMRALCQNI